MSSVHQYGRIWRDTYPGVWTAIVELFGVQMVAYAIEVRQDEDGWHPVESDEAQAHWRAFMEASRYEQEPNIIDLGGVKCVVYIV